MGRTALTLMAGLWALCSFAQAPSQTPGQRLSEAQAVALALEQNPEVRFAWLEVESARALGLATGPSTNPEVEVSGGQRQTGAGAQLEYEVALAQRFELGGQGRLRRALSGQRLEVAQARLRQARAGVRAEVRSSFYSLLAAGEALRLSEEELSLAQGLSEAARQKLALGAGSRLEWNAAVLEQARAARAVVAARRVRQAGLGQWRRLLGNPLSRPEPEGTLAPPEAKVLDEAAVLTAAQKASPGLEAARAEEAAAGTLRTLSHSEAMPSPRLGARYGKEGEEAVVQGTLSFELPVFGRQQVQKRQAELAQAQAQASARSLSAGLLEEVSQALSRLQAAKEEYALLGGQAAVAAEESQTLAELGYLAGEVDLLEVLVLRRQGLDWRRERLSALLEWVLAEVELERLVTASD